MQNLLFGTRIAGNEPWRVGALFLTTLIAMLAGKIGRVSLLAAARRADERGAGIAAVLLRDHEGMHPDFPPRVYFSEFNDASLNILVIYWYHPPEYWKFMEFGEKFNLELLRRFNAEGIDFAFPTQTLYLAGDPKRPLKV